MLMQSRLFVQKKQISWSKNTSSSTGHIQLWYSVEMEKLAGQWNTTGPNYQQSLIYQKVRKMWAHLGWKQMTEFVKHFHAVYGVWAMGWQHIKHQ
jgi:hypothetical protein